jgi:hypothetical protein
MISALELPVNTAITTFEQARDILAQHGLHIEKAPEPKLWRVGVLTLDKGGVIAKARELAARPRRSPAPSHVALNQIRTDGGTQARAALDSERMFAYLDDMIDGHQFPPIVVYYDGSTYWLADGFHRVEAARRWSNNQGPSTIAADIRSGTRRAAILHAVGANNDHGLRRSREDIRRAVELLLRDPEWRQWSDSEIARYCKVDHKTVGAHRKRLEATGEIPQSDVRQTAGGRTINTAPIAAANAERKAPAVTLPDRVQTGAVHPLMAQVMDVQPTDAPLPADLTDEEKAIARTHGYTWRTSILEPGMPARYVLVSAPNLTHTMTRAQFDNWLTIHRTSWDKRQQHARQLGFDGIEALGDQYELRRAGRRYALVSEWKLICETLDRIEEQQHQRLKAACDSQAAPVEASNELVLPPFPAHNRAALIGDIKYWLDHDEGEGLPHLSQFLRAIERFLMAEEA